MMTVMELHICKGFCSLRSAFPCVTVSVGLDRGLGGKNEGSAHSAKFRVFPCLYTISVVKPQRGE